jgi:hypothetical protein
LFIGYVSKISFEAILFSRKTMDTKYQHTGHRIFPGFSIIHANHLEDLRQVAVGWIKESGSTGKKIALAIKPMKEIKNE